VTLVDLDPAVVRLARTDPRLSTLNGGALDDRRVKVLNEDAFGWLRSATTTYDAVVVDLPDPDETATAKLYSVEFYTLLRHVVGPGGRVVVQAGSPYFAARSYWCIDASLHVAGYATTAYHVEVPSFGDWGYLLAVPGSTPPPLALAANGPSLRFLDADTLRAATVFPADRRRLVMEPSTLMQPRILEYAREDWPGY